MKQATVPYFHFNGNCREAMDFYKEILGGEMYLMTVGESPMKDQLPAAVHKEILHASLTNGEFRIMASDMCGMGEAKQGNTVEISLNCESDEEINRLYKSLSEGGQIVNELQDQFWGSKFAQVIDRFGIHWMLNYEK